MGLVSGQAVTLHELGVGPAGQQRLSYDWAYMASSTGSGTATTVRASTYRGVIELDGRGRGRRRGAGRAGPYPADPLNNLDLREAGADGVFDTADDVIYRLTLDPTYTTGTSVGLFIHRARCPAGIIASRPTHVEGSVGQSRWTATATGQAGMPTSGSFDVAIAGGDDLEDGNNDTRSTATALPLMEDPAGSGYLAGAWVGEHPAVARRGLLEFRGVGGGRGVGGVDTPDSGLNPAVCLYNAAGSQLATTTIGGPGATRSSATTRSPAAGRITCTSGGRVQRRLDDGQLRAAGGRGAGDPAGERRQLRQRLHRRGQRADAGARGPGHLVATVAGTMMAPEWIEHGRGPVSAWGRSARATWWS